MTRKIEIIPAVLPHDFAELEDKISSIVGMVKTVQIDVCDGQFTPQASWPYRKPDENFRKILDEENGLPGWEKLDFEIDLMANRPEELVADWLKAGAARLVIHAESNGDIAKAIAAVENDLEVGLALNIEMPLEILEPRISQIKFIQCMGIDKIGFQGRDFDSKVIAKVGLIREKYPEMIISVDGGVSLENAAGLIEAGASRLVIGSAIFESDNPVEALNQFKKM